MAVTTKVKGVSANKKVIKSALKNIDTYMTNAIKLIGQTGSTDENTLINKIESLNKEFHDTESVAKAYNDVNSALAKLESEMITIDNHMVTLQAYYNLLVQFGKS